MSWKERERLVADYARAIRERDDRIAALETEVARLREALEG